VGLTRLLGRAQFTFHQCTPPPNNTVNEVLETLSAAADYILRCWLGQESARSDGRKRIGNIRSGHAASDNPDTDHDIDDNADDDDGGDGDGDNDADDVIVMVLMPIVVRILLSKFHTGSAVINGSPRGSLRKSGSALDATAGSGKAMMQLDCTDVKLCT